MTERPASIEEALELYLAGRRAGDRTSPEEFAARHPALAPDLAAALQALAALEHAKAAPDEQALPGRIGAYRIVREIGRGGMGVVLEAIEEPLGRRVALKLISAELLASASARERFRREAALASRLEHPGIATVFAAGVAGERPWIAMRYVEGRTLAQAIVAARAAGAGCAQLPGTSGAARAQALALAACIARTARALHAAHEQGVVHRDVKPSNILVAPDGSPVLLDFGLAIADEAEGTSLTRTGETAGTPAYLAPELVGGARMRPDAQCDVYSLGVALYECLALQRPFEGPTPAALYRAILSSAPPGLRALPRDLAVVVATAMERERPRRYRSAAALADDLEACAAGRPIAARPVPLHGRIARWARRDPRQAVLAGLLALATLASAVFSGAWLQSRPEVRAAERLTRASQFETHLHQGFGNLAANWLDEAEQEFLGALEIDARSSEAIAGRAFVRLKRGDDSAALALLADAPATPAFRALRELVSGLAPEPEQSQEWFASASAVELFVDGMRLSRQFERASRPDRAPLARLALARFSEAILRSKTSRMLYHVERAQAAKQTGDESAIRSAAGTIVVLWPDHERAYFTAGNALLRIDPRAAVPLLERAIELDPSWAAPYQNLGNALMALQDYAGAERALRRAIALKPTDADALNSLGMVLARLDCPDEARAAYLRALGSRPMFETLANLAVLDARSGDPALAEAELRLALERDPRENRLRLPLAKLLHEQSASQAALAEIEAVVGFDPANAEAWSLLASWRGELGDSDAAARALEVLRELEGSR